MFQITLARLAAAIESAATGIVQAFALTISQFIDLPSIIARAVPAATPRFSALGKALVQSHRGVTIAAIGVIAGLPVLTAGFFAVAAVTNPYFTEDLAYAHDRSSALEIRDARGRWIGIIPPAEFSDWSNGAVLPPDHSAMIPATIPSVWRKCIVALEDHQFDSLSRWLGVDPVAVIKSGALTLVGDRRRGASTLYMQVVRELEGETPSAEEAPGEIALRKLAELFGANALVTMLDKRDIQAAARLVAMHTPLVIGSAGSHFGNPIFGIELANQILFGTSTSVAPVENQAILAAAIKAPVLLAPPGDTTAQAHARARWARIKVRADFCLRSAFSGQDPEILAARQRLALIPLPQPAIDPDLRRLLPADPQAAWRILVNPVRRAEYFMGPELEIAKTQLDTIYGGTEWRGRVIGIRLTVAADENRQFTSNVKTTLDKLQFQTRGMAISLEPGSEDTSAAQVIIAVADPAGRLRLLYSSQPQLLWRWKTQMASTVKMIAAVALGSHDLPATMYCRAPLPGMNSPGDDRACDHRAAWIPATEAFARSSNEAINWRLRRVPPHELERIAENFDLPPFGATPPATALTLGTVELTPAQMLKVAAAIGAGLSGGGQGAQLPTIIDEMTTLDAAGRPSARAVKGGQEISSLKLRTMFTAPVRSFVASALSATSDEHGTLRALGYVKARTGNQLFAKTGTDSAAHQTYAIHILGIFMLAGRPWSFLVTAGSPNQRTPLGRDVVAGQFAGVAGLAVLSAVTANTKQNQTTAGEANVSGQ